MRRARGSLSQAEILDGAQELVERHGLSELSMPMLARHLGSGVTSIYWYFRSKEDLLQALADRVARAVYGDLPSVGDRPWDEELVDYFAAFRVLVRTNPVYRELFAYRPRLAYSHAAIAPSLFRRLDAGLQMLVDGAGMDLAQAVEAMNVCAHFTLGFVLLEHGLETDPTARLPTDDLLRPLDGLGLPMVGALHDIDAMLRLDDEAFLVGLRTVVAGLRVRLTAPPRARGAAAEPG